MKSPACPELDLRRVILDEGLPAWECPGSGGYWIGGDDYRIWLEKQTREHPVAPVEQGTDVRETPRAGPARLCPETGQLLTRYKVGHGLSFSVDFSAATGGIWLDRDEWEALRSHHLHDEIHRVFTASWQKAVRDEQRARELRREFERRLGEAFPKAEEFRRWLREQPQQRDILIFLADPGL